MSNAMTKEVHEENKMGVMPINKLRQSFLWQIQSRHL